MEQKHQINDPEQFWHKEEKAHQRGKIFGGLLVVAAGSLFLAKELGAEMPQWIFTWKMFLIAVGLTIGIKHKFLHPAWLVLVLIGGSFLLADIYPGISIKPFLGPVLIIVFGLFIMFKPRRKRREHGWKKWQERRHHRHDFENDCYTKSTSTNDEVLDYTTFMGAVKKTVLTKNFKGGDITVVFGGTELNLSQADIESTATLDLSCVFAGAKLVVPANWEINSEIVAVFGSVEDKRPVQPKPTDGSMKVLTLKGTVFFGGIDIKSY